MNKETTTIGQNTLAALLRQNEVLLAQREMTIAFLVLLRDDEDSLQKKEHIDALFSLIMFMDSNVISPSTEMSYH